MPDEDPDKADPSKLDDKEIEIEVADNSSGFGELDIPGMPGGSVGMINLNDVLGKALGGRTKTRKLSVRESYDVLLADESDKLLDEDQIVR